MCYAHRCIWTLLLHELTRVATYIHIILCSRWLSFTAAAAAAAHVYKLFSLAIVLQNKRTGEKDIYKKKKKTLFDFRAEHRPIMCVVCIFYTSPKRWHVTYVVIVRRRHCCDGTRLYINNILRTLETFPNNNVRVQISCIVNVSLMCF